MKHAWWIVPLFAMSLASCSCRGCANSIDAGGGGTGQGADAGDDGGSGGGAGGGSGGGVGADGGDGTTWNTIDPGGWVLDGGSGAGDGVKLDPNGYLTLNSSDVQLHFMWIANNSEGTVSKFDTKTGKEVGRYYAAFPRTGSGANSGLTGDPSYGHSPSRTAIDLYGDVWVANRAPGTGKQGSVTKIANDPATCIDRNGNGQIDTSKDADGDGNISASEMITPSDWSDPNQYDECILFTQPLGDACTNSGCVNARAIAISVPIEGGAGDVWVGLHEQHRFYKLRNTDGAPQPVAGGAPYVDLGWGPYGAAVDSQQRLWAVRTGMAQLALIDTGSGTLISDQLTAPSTHTANASYGIAIDGKDRVWLAGWSSGPKASRYDHGPGLGTTVGTWTAFDFSGAVSDIGTGLGYGRGIAADEEGNIWMSASHQVGTWSPVAQLIAFNSDTGTIRPFQTASGPKDFIDATDANTNQSIGVGLDGDGQPWVNNYSGNAMRIDRTTGQITRTGQQSGTLYTYSDFTGYQLRKFTAPRGTYRQDFTGCGSGTHWRTLNWQYNAPTGSAVEAWIKVADSLAALGSSSTPKYGPFTAPPVDLLAAGVPSRAYARVEFVLKSLDAKTNPILQSFQLNWACDFQ